MVRSLLAFIALFCFASLSAQTPTPTVAKAQSTRIMLKGGTVHTAKGDVIENAYVMFDQGRITGLGPLSSAPSPVEGQITLELGGKHVYPGLIAPNTTLGINEIGAVRATRDNNEVGDNNANVRSIIAYSTDSRVTPTIRSNGILLAQVSPRGGRIAGTSCVVQLDAWNWEDAAVSSDDGIWINWPRIFTRGGWWAEPGDIEKNDEYAGQLDELRQFMNETRAYLEIEKPEKVNLKMEAFREVFAGNQNVYINVNRSQEILAALDFIEHYGIKGVLVGAQDAWLIPEIIAEKKVPVILGSTHALPAQNDDDIDQAFKTPKILQDNGVLFCLHNGGFWEERNLMFMAGSAAAYGLEKEEALAAISLNAAKILGIDQDYGSIEKGKSATLIVTEGDLLDMRSSHVTHAFIDGRVIQLENKQKALYERYRTKYGLGD